jgi:hypothetical protein
LDAKKGQRPDMGAGLSLALPLRLVPVVLIVIPITVVVSAPPPSLFHLGSIFFSLAAMIAMLPHVRIEFRPRAS